MRGIIRRVPRTSKMAVNRLPDLLWARANAPSPGSLIIYPSNNTHTPTEITYTSLYTQALRGSKQLRTLDGFQVGRPVILHLPDHWDAILWFWVTLLAGGVPVLTPPFSNDPAQRDQHLDHLSTVFESPLCITTTKLLGLFDGHHQLRLHAVESLLQAELPAGLEHEDYRSKPTTQQQAHETAFLMMTSGSTGNSKAVRITHRQCLASISCKSSVYQLPPNCPFLNWIGLDHVGSLVEIHLQALWMSVNQIHVPAADIVTSPRFFLDLLSRHRVSRTFAPNFFLARLATVLGTENGSSDPEWDLSRLKFLGSGGEANDVDTCVALSALLSPYGAPSNIITPGFGMTETCAGCIYNTSCPSYEISNDLQFAALGHCMRGVEMRIVAADGETLTDPEQHGDLQVRGAVVFPGYYNNPEATAAAFTPDGWFRTGDRALIDAEGSLRLVGRAKDVMNINGIKINTTDVQTAIDRAVKWKVDRIIAFPTRASGAHTEQVTVAFVPRGDSEAADLEDIIVETVLLCTESRPVVFSLPCITHLPQTTLGKVSRDKMTTLFQAGAFQEHITSHRHYVDEFRRSKNNNAVDSCTTPANSTEIALLSAFKSALDVQISDHLDVNMSIFTFGCTSMDLIRLRRRICDLLQVDIPTITLIKHPTVRSLATFLDHTNPSPSPTSAPSSYDPLVTLHSGSPSPTQTTPLWLIHPGVGEVLVFVGLAQHLATADPTRPIYALRARGFESGESSFESIAEPVEAYHAAIRRVQPEGPYALAGYSYGAMLAFEVAKVLEGHDGQEVRFLGSFNLPPYIRARWKPLSWPVCLLQLLNFLGLCGEEYVENWKAGGEERLDGLARENVVEVILGEEGVDGAMLPEIGVDVEGLKTWADVVYGLQRSAVGYLPSGSVGVMDVFHATPLKAVGAESQEDWVDNYLGRWREFCKTEVRFHAVGGAHYTIIGGDHVAGFARTLMSALKGRGV